MATVAGEPRRSATCLKHGEAAQLSAQVRTAVRPCQHAAAAGTSTHALTRASACDAYANTKQ